MINKTIFFAAALVMSPIANAGVVNSYLSNVTVNMSTDPVTGNETVYVTTKLTSNFGILPVTLPILNPKNVSQTLGTVAMVSDITGKQFSLQIAVDVTAAMKSKSLGLGLLPNGTMIPVGANPMNWLDLALPNKLGHLYLNLDMSNKTAVIGTAINVAAFGTGFPMNMLIPFNVKNIGGLAGIYTGAKGSGGFGLFVDGSALFKK